MNELLFLMMTLCALIFTMLFFRMGIHWLYVYVGICIVLANIFVTKQINLFGVAATGGNIVYGLIFLATDLLSEHYGKSQARKAVVIGFASALFYLVMSQFMKEFIPNEYDTVSDGMTKIFDFAPRLILASMTAYLVSQFHDIWVFHFLKLKTSGRFLWLRNNVSTWISQLIDSTVFCFLAFSGILPVEIIFQVILSTYILKIIVALIDTPFIYLSYYIKPPENPEQYYESK